MGQVLGFSHCQEYGSVASTPDSTPPCTDGGNEESELYELQTAREWSEDEEEDEGGDQDDDEGLASSSSVWGTPRQSSFELTFSYFAIAEPEAVGASRHLRDRRRGAPRSGRTALIRTDTLETLLDSPDVDWDAQAFLSREEEEEALGGREPEEWTGRETGGREAERRGRPNEPAAEQRSLQEPEVGAREGDAGIQRGETQSFWSQAPHRSQGSSPSQSPQHGGPTQSLQAAAAAVEAAAAEASPAPEPESASTSETVSVKLLTSAGPRGPRGDLASTPPAAGGRNTQEQLVSEHWFSALNLSEDSTVRIHIAVMELIYWKDTERTGMVLTGLVVGLLSLFQLSIVTVVSTLSLAVMCFSISVRIYYQFLHLLNWGDGEHPFKSYLDLDLSLGGEQTDHYMQKAIVMVLSAVDTLKSLFLVGNLFDSIKFLALIYLVTFLGKLCNGLTLLIIGVIALFSLPLLYRQHQEQVDGFFGKIQAKIDNVKDFLQRLVQGGGPTPDPTPGGAKPKSQ